MVTNQIQADRQSPEVKREGAAETSVKMEIDVKAIIEQMGTGEQDTALTALQSYNQAVRS